VSGEPDGPSNVAVVPLAQEAPEAMQTRFGALWFDAA
jgi:hypothetical protein